MATLKVWNMATKCLITENMLVFPCTVRSLQTSLKKKSSGHADEERKNRKWNMKE